MPSLSLGPNPCCFLQALLQYLVLIGVYIGVAYEEGVERRWAQYYDQCETLYAPPGSSSRFVIVSNICSKEMLKVCLVFFFPSRDGFF